MSGYGKLDHRIFVLTFDFTKLLLTTCHSLKKRNQHKITFIYICIFVYPFYICISSKHNPIRCVPIFTVGIAGGFNVYLINNGYVYQLEKIFSDLSIIDSYTFS